MRNESAKLAEAEPANRFVDLDGLRLHYLDWGGDPRRRTFLMLHGGAAHAHWWSYVAPQLIAHGRVLALDFRGHGRSAWPRPPHYGPHAYIEDVRAVLETLGTRVVLVGHSMGGSVAQWCAIKFPEKLQALIIVDAPNGPPPLLRRLQWRWRRKAQGGPRPELPSADTVARKFRLSPPGSYLTPEQMRELAMLGSEQLPNGNWVFRFDPETRAWRKIEGKMQRPRLKSIKLPTLILRGAESALVSQRRALRMNRKIEGSVYREIPRAFHHVPLDNPDATASEIIAFVESI